MKNKVAGSSLGHILKSWKQPAGIQNYSHNLGKFADYVPSSIAKMETNYAPSWFDQPNLCILKYF